MRLSDQIDLIREALPDDYQREDESTGEAAVRLIEELHVELRAALVAGADVQNTDGLCDSCTWLKPDGFVPRLCQSIDAIQMGFARRGYPCKDGHGCECWAPKVKEAPLRRRTTTPTIDDLPVLDNPLP